MLCIDKQQIQRFLAYEPMPPLEEISMLPFSHGGENEGHILTSTNGG
jgi:hypothetical protein